MTATVKKTERKTNMPVEREIPHMLEQEAGLALPIGPVVPKKRQLLHLISQPGGIRIGQLVKVLGWQAHTVRATISGLRKRGHVILASKASVTGELVYKLMSGSAAASADSEGAGE